MGYPFSAPNGYEEPLNRQFAGFLHYSLRIGPELVNGIHRDHPIAFSDEASVVANQNSPLPQYTETGSDRELDWVIGDADQLVGYESKYGDRLREDQLRDELEKLRLNADGRNVALVTVTPHTVAPRILDRFPDVPVYWVSWYAVSRRLRRIDESDLPPEQRPVLRMLRDLFEAEDMHSFTGFDHHDNLQYRYFVRDLRQELAGTGLENREEVHTWTTTDPDPSPWKRLVPKYLDVPFVRASRDESSGTKRASYLTVIVDTERHEAYAGIVFNVREVPSHRDFVSERADELIEYAERRGLQLWASMNSLNQWEHEPPRTSDPAEMKQWLEAGTESSVRVDGVKFKKAIFVDRCAASDPSKLVREAAETLLELDERFLGSDDIYPQATLAERE